MARIEMDVRYVRRASYERPSYGYGYETVYIHKFEDADGKIYVWKTTNILMKDGEEIGGDMDSSRVFPNIGAMIKIRATEKGESDYKGEHQIDINRVKVLDIIEQALTKEEKQQLKAEQQLASLQDGDFVWKAMPYKQYKQHYADCETVAGSYKDCDAAGRPADRTIDVIIRDGRLKNSGVRGQRFQYWVFRDADNNPRTYYAVSYENAYKRLIKDYPDQEWTIDMASTRCMRIG